MNPIIIDLEDDLGGIRDMLTPFSDLKEARLFICKAQNLIQKHIEKNYPPSLWKHTNTEAPTKYKSGEE